MKGVEMNTRKELVNTIIRELEACPNKCRIDTYRVKIGDVAIWIANGLFFTHIESPVFIKLSVIEQLRVIKSVNKLKVLICLKAIDKAGAK